MTKKELNRTPIFVGLGLLIIPIVAILGVGVFIATNWLYTTIVVQRAIEKGVYPSPEAGMIENSYAYYAEIEKMEIMYSGPNSFDGSQPHVWYVIAHIYGAVKKDGQPEKTYYGKAYIVPGGYYVHTKEGWVQMPEGFFPEYLGFWMQVFGLAGPGSPTPSVDGKDW